MAIDSFLPQIGLLRERVEYIFGRKPAVHNDFVDLADDITQKTREYISAITLERLWQYSTRTSDKVLLHTLNLLCDYTGNTDWETFCNKLRKESDRDSDMFDDLSISVDSLSEGDRIRFAWMPDRICIVRYLGRSRFIAEECTNSTIQPGDTFSCNLFQLSRPLYLDNFETASGEKKNRYAVGISHGITSLKII